MEKRKNIVVVAISKIFSTGINIKNLHYIIFAGGGKAKIKIVQSIGSGLRLHIDKEELIIFDIADNLRYGKRHIEQRLSLYDSEDIKYKFTQYYEQKTKKQFTINNIQMSYVYTNKYKTNMNIFGELKNCSYI